ncbi:hypothetical protein MAP00_005046 [Monascus purpureus]|nr:hypothetical protein MAP00_005046 [Monascus purpureus]
MHTPSPQLLRALRTSITSSTLHRTIAPQVPSTSLIAGAVQLSPSKCVPPHRNNSNMTRPARMIPRAHTNKPTTHDRGPRSSEQTQTDFACLDVLGNVPAPTTAIDACLDDGFHLDNGVKVTGGDGVLLVGGEAFAWRPWRTIAAGSDNSNSDSKTAMVNAKGQFEVDEQAWGLLGLVWPRPDLLILGMGASMLPLSPETKRQINSLGIRVEVQDTRNAAAQFNLLATERGVSEVAAALIPTGWRGR